MQQCRLAAVELACRRGDRVLLHKVDFVLGPGEALHLAGPNGIGKSSLIRLLAGLLRPFAGHVERTGALALADERPALDPQQPLARALGFWAGFDGIAPGVLDHAMAALGLARLGDVPVRYLSTGQRKRAVLARVVAGAAPIWLLDEPFNGLDGDACKVLEGLLAEHAGRGGIAVIASHQAVATPNLLRLTLADHIPMDEPAA